MKTFLIFITFMLLGCSKVEIKTVNLKEIKNERLIFLNDKNPTLKNWLGYYKDLDSTFSEDKFYFESENVINIFEGHIYGLYDKNFDKIYANFLVYDEKGNKYLDFDSYQWNVEDGKIHFEVDQEINLVNIPEKTVKRIGFFGSSSWVEDAYWKNDNICVLLENSQDRKPIISELNLKTNKIKIFKYDVNLKFDSHYSEVRILKILKKN
jgi:hypothetical protein